MPGVQASSESTAPASKLSTPKSAVPTNVAVSTRTGVVPTQSAEQSGQVSEAATPRIDLIETTDNIVIFAELPGYNEDNIVIEAIDQQVRISAEREDADLEEGRPHIRERLLSVERTVFLPAPVSVKDADATFQEGICRIEIPKIEENRAHRIGFH